MRLRIQSLEIFYTTMRDKKISYVNYGGLGDHLSFSTIPEMCDKNGYDFYISNDTIFRNNEIFELVWKLNPFFKGVTDEKPNCGHNNYTNLENYDYNLSLQRNYEIKMGFGGTTLEHGSKFPIIYYTPKKIDIYDEYILIDLNAVSHLEYNINVIKNHILNYKDEKFLFLTPTYSKSLVDINFFTELNITEITTSDIFDYCDIIFSCKKLICLWSGSSVLSATIKNQYHKKLEIDCFVNYNIVPNFGVSDKTHFWYDNINYIKGH